MIIVESPKKAKTIQKFLGAQYSVVATVGHFRDLPKKALGVDMDTFNATYVCEGRGAEVRKKLAEKISVAGKVYLATDLDREGEAIAWHIIEEFGLPAGRYERLVYGEVTEKAVRRALANPVPLNLQRVEAQKARRVLDRMIGYPISSELRRQTFQNLSAGRVQSVALMLVVMRERAIQNHKPIPHFTVKYGFHTEQGSFVGEWDISPFISDNCPYILDRNRADIAAGVKRFVVASAKNKPRERHAPAPFITLTMQQAASNKLEISVEDAMKAAQELFDKGYITYHRTDNPNLSEDGIREIRDHIASVGCADDLPKEPPTFSASSDAQEAHEGIRPTNIKVRDVEDCEDPNAKAIYELIRLRAIASQMRPALYDVTELVLQSEPLDSLSFQPVTVKAKGRTLRYQGWLKVMPKDDSSEEQEEENLVVPLLDVGVELTCQQSQVVNHKTNAPKRYSETGLLNELEREGVGRPATYASILGVLKKRGLVTFKGRFFYANDVGAMVVDGLIGKFKFMDVGYTREIERGLDCIAQGSTTYQAVLQAASMDLREGIQKLRASPVMQPKHCFKCQAPMKKIISKDDSFEPFWVCTQEEACGEKYYDINGEPSTSPGNPDCPCPVCKAPMRRARRTMNKGEDNEKKVPYWFCTRWKEGCKTSLKDRAGKPVKANKCPKCKANILTKREGEYGPFWSCNGYPKCKASCPDSNGKPQLKKIK